MMINNEQHQLEEIYRQLWTNIEFSSITKKLQVICVTSTNPSEGKTTVSSNFAKICIPKYQRVLLMDCDLRRPKIHKQFKKSNQLGLSDLLINLNRVEHVPNEYFQKYMSEFGTLHILSAGTRVPNPNELLGSKKFERLLDLIRENFDFIIMDCPPVLAVSDIIPVAHVSDGTLFVVSAKETNKHDAHSAITQLKRNGVNIIGCVLTKTDVYKKDYYTAGY